MDGSQTATELAEELEQFQTEQEKIRQLVGQIGGRASLKREKHLTWIFAVALVLLFASDGCRHVFGIAIPLPPLFSIELGVLLVSVKIVWMIHKQSRVEHFQFWILHAIEFRINDMAKSLRRLEEELGRQDRTSSQAVLRTTGGPAPEG